MRYPIFTTSIMRGANGSPRARCMNAHEWACDVHIQTNELFPQSAGMRQTIVVDPAKCPECGVEPMNVIGEKERIKMEVVKKDDGEIIDVDTKVHSDEVQS